MNKFILMALTILGMVGLVPKVAAQPLVTSIHFDFYSEYYTYRRPNAERGVMKTGLGYHKQTGEIMLCLHGVYKNQTNTCESEQVAAEKPKTIQQALDFSLRIMGVEADMTAVGWEFVQAGGNGYTIDSILIHAKPTRVEK